MPRSNLIPLELMRDIRHKLMDRDFVDIRRQLPGYAQFVEVHSNVPCSLQERRTTVPAIDPMTQPILQRMVVSALPNVDILNGDILICKKMNLSGRNMLAHYQMRAEMPYVSQSRQRVEGEMQARGETYVPTPPPIQPEEGYAVVHIGFKDTHYEEIQNTITYSLPLNIEWVYLLPELQGFIFYGWSVNGIIMYPPDTTGSSNDPTPRQITLAPTEKTYHIVLKYQPISEPYAIRLIATGMFMRNDGSFGFGMHTFRLMPILYISPNSFAINEIEGENFRHPHNTQMRLRIEPGLRFMLVGGDGSNKQFAGVSAVTPDSTGYVVEFEDIDDLVVEETSMYDR